MPSYCTDCGGELVWDRKQRMHSCKSCGTMFTESQLSEAMDKRFERPEDDEDRRRRRHSDYLDWWTSSKKKSD
jgi:predicted RNA-binding Zn-ribbon protein involved in translation (DUF1610 family)